MNSITATTVSITCQQKLTVKIPRIRVCQQAWDRIPINMPPTFFKISGHSIIPGDWGDYGDILQQGMGAHSEEVHGRMQLERTGPYIPPITFPGLGGFVMTSKARSMLELSGLNGYSFRQIDKKLIVELHWEEWDLSSSEPAFFPETGEPEDYILGQSHSPQAAAAMGDLWEVTVPRTVTVLRPCRIVESYKELTIDSGTWNGDDIFASEDVGYTFFTERAQNWFFGHFGEYVDFEEFPAV